MLSKRFAGGEIIAANAGFVIIFEAANLMGPGHLCTTALITIISTRVVQVGYFGITG